MKNYVTTAVATDQELQTRYLIPSPLEEEKARVCGEIPSYRKEVW